jgi:hypothetical protein
MLVFIYFIASLLVAFSHPLPHSWPYALCVALSSFVALISGATLQAAFQHYRIPRKIGYALTATVLMFAAQYGLHGFSLHFFGYLVSGSLWIWIGFLVGFLFSTPRLSAG